MKNLTKKLNEIQQKLKAPKGQKNTFGNYKYRSCEDIMEAVKPLLGGYVLLISDEIIRKKDILYNVLLDNFYGFITKHTNDGDTIWSKRYRHPEYNFNSTTHYVEDIIDETIQVATECENDEVVQQFSSLSLFSETTNIKIQNIQIEENIALVNVSYQYKSGISVETSTNEKVTTTYKLQKINNKWLIIDRTKGSLGGAWLTTTLTNDSNNGLKESTEAIRIALYELREECKLFEVMELTCSNDKEFTGNLQEFAISKEKLPKKVVEYFRKNETKYNSWGEIISQTIRSLEYPKIIINKDVNILITPLTFTNKVYDDYNYVRRDNYQLLDFAKGILKIEQYISENDAKEGFQKMFDEIKVGKTNVKIELGSIGEEQFSYSYKMKIPHGIVPYTVIDTNAIIFRINNIVFTIKSRDYKFHPFNYEVDEYQIEQGELISILDENFDRICSIFD
jgi:hypothetical protein